jgi:outer membrane protein assembly factor BamB
MRTASLCVLLACLCSCALAQSWGNVVWSYMNSDSVESTVTISADNSTIYYNTYGGFAVAAKAIDGSILWYNQQMGEMIRTTSLLVPLNSSFTALYLIAGDAQLWCLNAANGHTVWAVPTGGKKQEFQSSSPAYYNGKVIFGNVGGMVVAVDAVSGSKVWTFKTADEIYSSAKVGPLSSAPDSKYIVTIGSDDGNLYALDPDTGAVVWNVQTSAYVRGSAAFITEPNLNNGNSIVLFGSNDGKVRSIDAVSGKTFWFYQTKGPAYAAPLPYYDQTNGKYTVFAGSYDQNVYALDGNTGSMLWNYTTIGYLIASPALARVNNQLRVYVGAGGDQTMNSSLFYCFDGYAGSLIGTAEIYTSSVWATAAIVQPKGTTEQLVVVSDQSGVVWAYTA